MRLPQIAILVFCCLCLSFSIGIAPQQQVVDGSFVDGVNPPSGIGNCWDSANQQVVQKLILTDFECDGLNYCQAICECCAGISSPGGCDFRKTHSSVQVGSCEVAHNRECTACPTGSEVFCMIYKYYSLKISGVCSVSCNEWQVHFSGTCVN